MNLRITRVVSVLACAAGAAGQTQTYQFTLNPAASGLSGTLAAGVDASGALIGNWNATSNPTGTRTKPGLFGSFGPMENVPVPTTISGDVGGPLDSEGAGSLRLRLNPAALTCELTAVAVDFVPGAPIIVPADATIDFDSFRTRSPDSTYPGVPISLPVDAEVTDLNMNQSIPATGTLTGGIPGVFLFEVTAAVDVSGSVSVLGNAVELPPTPLLLLFQGTVTLTPTGATLTSSQPVTLVQNQQPSEPLPQFPLDIPTVLPPGATAHLLMDLVLDQFTFNLSTTLTLSGEGVPLPGCYPDCTGEGSLTVADFGCFQTRFVAGQPYADCTADGLLTVADFGCFQTRFVMGCP